MPVTERLPVDIAQPQSLRQAEIAFIAGRREAAAFRLQHACADFRQHAMAGG
jgi:hypothetical protein